MFVDYNFYTDIFKSTSLSEDSFYKFGNAACIYISNKTLSRITDSSIERFPNEVKERTRLCACALIEYLALVEETKKNIGANLETNLEEGGGNIKSKTAGRVSITYDNSISQNLISGENREKEMQTILNLYLSPIRVGTTYYNLLAKAVPGGRCRECSIN
jgi:hypothetical protein